MPIHHFPSGMFYRYSVGEATPAQYTLHTCGGLLHFHDTRGIHDSLGRNNPGNLGVVAPYSAQPTLIILAVAPYELTYESRITLFDITFFSVDCYVPDTATKWSIRDSVTNLILHAKLQIPRLGTPGRTR